MTTFEPQRLPNRAIYLSDKLTEVAGIDFDVELDALLTDETLPLAMRVEVAQAREDLLTELTKRIRVLRGHVERRNRIQAERVEYAKVKTELEQQREAQRVAAERQQQAERLMLDNARRRAAALGIVIEPIKWMQETQRGGLQEGHEHRSWRVAAPLDSQLVKALPPENVAHLTRTLDRKSVEIVRGTLRACAEYVARAAANTEDEVKGADDAPRGLFRRR